MKLYIFETCPFSARARIMAGLKGLAPELVHVAPGQIPEGLEGRIDRLTVPILVDGETLIQESTEIIRYFDEIGTALLNSYATSPEYDQISSELSPLMAPLVHPRAVKLGVPELSGPDAARKFEQMMTPKIGMSFTEALARTHEFSEPVSAKATQLSRFLNDEPLTFDTIAACATLLNLSMVAELHLSADLSHRFHRLMADSRVPLFTPITQDGVPRLNEAS